MLWRRKFGIASSAQRLMAAAAWFLVCGLVSGCSSVPDGQLASDLKTNAAGPAGAGAGVQSPTVQKGDKLKISVFNEPLLSGEYVVWPTGTISYPLLGEVPMAGLTVFFINASTNKVYGKMEEIATTERNGRYEYLDLARGVPEAQPLDFHSPYGCSKGVADQYVIDYARIYGLDTVTFRQSCIYGTRQFGIEDQGWVAWFTIAAVLGKQITIYGDGKQIRDVLHVDDLARAYEAAYDNRATCRGQAFNIGGGAGNTMSLMELLGLLQHELQLNIPLKWGDWRPGDQPVFVCDISKARERLGWEPKIGVEQGVGQLIGWVRDNKQLFSWLA